MRLASTSAVLAVMLLAGGCSAVPGLEEDLAIQPPADCGQEADAPGGLHYWFAGLSPQDIYWQGCDKSGAQLSGRHLTDAVLTETNLSGADLRGADLRVADMARADLSNADLSGAKMLGANIRWTNLRGANLSDTDLTGVSLSGTELTGATWSDGKVCQENSISRCIRE